MFCTKTLLISIDDNICPFDAILWIKFLSPSEIHAWYIGAGNAAIEYPPWKPDNAWFSLVKVNCVMGFITGISKILTCAFFKFFVDKVYAHEIKIAII